MHTRSLIRWLIVLAVALVAGCATVPRSVDISQQQIEAALARRFPYEARPVEILSVKFGVPRVQLQPDVNRLRLDVGMEAVERISRTIVHGDAALSFGVRYEPSDATIRLADVHVESIELRGLPDRWRRPVEVAGIMAAEQLLEGSVLHQFRPEQLQRAQGWTPGDIRVTATGVRIDLVPPAR